MFPNLPAKTKDEYTNPLFYLKGSFDLGASKLPYFTTTLTTEKARELIRFPYQVNVRNPTNIEELFQRDLDANRVETQIVPYLKRQGVKFFNALTVALLPLDAEHCVLDSFPEGDENAPEPEGDPSATILQIGPVRIYQNIQLQSLGRICWNKQLVAPMVVDGQHRLSAIRHLLDDQDYLGRPGLSKTEIPVIFLVLDKRAGFEQTHEDESVIRAVRAIFVDLNKHAVPVSQTRNLLLDDRSVEAVCMRAMINTEIGEGSRQSNDERTLVLSMIDWYAPKDSAKFDRGIHLTSVLVLHSIVVECLGLPAYKPTELDSVSTFLDRLSARLHLGSLFRKGIKERAEEAADATIPFSLGRSDMESIRNAFLSVWAPALSAVFYSITPYREFIASMKKHTCLGGELELWAALDTRGKRSLLSEQEELKSKTDEAKLELEGLKEGDLAFQVVFQRAIFSSFITLESSRPERCNWIKSGQTVMEFTTEWCLEYNRRIGCLTKAKDAYSEVWIGAGLKANTTIAYSKASQKAIGGFLSCALLAPMDEWLAQSSSEAADGLALTMSLERLALEWVGEFATSTAKESKDDYFQTASQSLKPWLSQLQSVIKDRLRARDEEIPNDEILKQSAKAEAAKNLSRVAYRLQSSFGPHWHKDPANL